jgi:hypothetical protein
MSGFPQGFKIVGGGDFGSKLPGFATKMLKYLDTMPFKELVDVRTLADKVGCTYSTIKANSQYPVFAQYKVSSGGMTSKNLFGSKKTIREFKRLRDKQNED